MTVPGREGELLAEADRAERAGDLVGAATRLRAHLAARPGDAGARLRLAQMLITIGEPTSARRVLEPLDRFEFPEAPDAPDGHGDGGGDRAHDVSVQSFAQQANRLLARLDERDGLLTAALVRWERALARDIDDPEARTRLRALRPDDAGWPSSLALPTLASPEGVRTSRFRMVRELGRGASAAVYLVHDERLRLPLALKVLHPQLAAAARATAREQFFAEARLAARLRHPGVVAIFDVDETARCLAMEYVAGGTVRDRVRTLLRLSNDGAGAAGAASTAVDVREAIDTARSLLGALAYVHGAGVVHGDLKPGNVLLRRPGEVVLADFGAGALAAVGDGSLVSTSTAAASASAYDLAVGTPLYLAPEQFKGAGASTRTDLFAAGAILWELVCGRPARAQSNLLADRHAAPTAIPDDARARLGPTGASLASIILALLAQDPTHRPPTAQAALTAIG